MKKHQVIYITGHPAAGKTTLLERLARRRLNVRGFVYSKLLADYVSKKSGARLTQIALRSKSASVVTPEDIQIVDNNLIKSVRVARKKHHVLIDSHAVTKEKYGYRVTAFSVPVLRALNPTKICVLFTDSDTVIKRIKTDAKGRPQISNFEADFHCFTQAALAVVYGVQVGVPVYFFDNSGKHDEALKKLCEFLEA